MPTSYENDLLNSVVNVQAKQEERKTIDILTAEMKPLAASNNGLFAIQDLLANQAAPKEQRAAAAQVLNPGMSASIGPNGELSFSNIPGSDVGTDYAVKINKPVTSNPAQGIEDFDRKFMALQSMTDPVEVMNTYANLQGAATSYINDKTNRVKTRLEQSAGVPGIRSALQESQALDKQHFDLYYNGVNQGPSEETLSILNQLNSTQSKIDSQVGTELKQDPEISVLQAKLATLNSFAESKYRSLQDPDKALAASLVPAEQIDATMLALGADASDPLARTKVAEGLISGNQTINIAQQIGLADPATLVQAAAFGSGPQQLGAKRVLEAKTGNSSNAQFLINQVKNFETMYPDEAATNKDLYQLSTTDKLASPKQQEASQAMIQARKVQFVLQQVQSERANDFISKVDQWQAPQDESLKEIPTIVQDLKKLNPDEPIRLDKVIQRMDWQGGDRADKMKRMTAFINSQAATMQGNEFFGAPMIYSNPQLTERYIQSLVIARTAKLGFAENINQGNFNFIPQGGAL